MTPSGDGAAIRTGGLTKRFRGGQVAVDGIDLSVPSGAVYGFLGPNGSGKTTTIRMLLGLIFPTAGTVELLGEPIPAGSGRVLPRVGSLIDGPAFYPYLSGQDNLSHLDAAAAWRPRAGRRDRVAAALDRVGLGAAAGKRYRNYSLGMRQRLAIAAALLQPRDVLVLDEPTNGLDPQGTREVRHLITELARDGLTVFISSHLLSEIEQVCSHVGIMRAGSLVWQGDLARLGAQRRPVVAVSTADAGPAAAVLAELGLDDVRPVPDGVRATLAEQRPEAVAAALVHAGVGLRGFVVERPSLEEAFVDLTGEGFDVDE